MKTLFRPAACARISFAALLLILGGLPLTHSEAAAVDPAGELAQWPQLRGPGGHGVIDGTEVPLRWSETENVLWKTPIEGRGHSAPIVWGDRIFLTTAAAGEEIPGAKAPVHIYAGEEFLHPSSLGVNKKQILKVIALDTVSGEIVWSKVAFEGQVYDNRHEVSSYVSPTPVTDGERVYTYFGSQGVYAWDFDGNQTWSADIGKIKTVGLGVGTSPVLWEDFLILQVDEGEGPDSFLVALDRRTGKEAWRKARANEATWTTPLLVEDSSGQAQLLTSGMESIISYDPANGEEIWRAPGLESNSIHVPMQAGDLALFSAGYPTKITMAIPLSSRGEVTIPTWTYNKGTAYVSSNVSYEGLLYLTSDAGVLTCLDARTGEVIYEGGRVPLPGVHMASLLAVDGKILQINRDGDATFIKAGREHEVLASNTIDEGVYATPAITRDRIYIRSLGHLYAIGAVGGD